MASIDHLERMRTQAKYSKVEDYYILRGAVRKSYGVEESPELDPVAFSEAHNLVKWPRDAYDLETIQEFLDYRSIGEGSYPAGNTFDEQFESLLPSDAEFTSADPVLRNAMTHLLGRSVIGLPETLPGPGCIEGLDFLSSALLHLYYLGLASRTPIRWLEALQSKEGEKGTQVGLTTRWHPRSLRMDGAVNSRYEWLLRRVRSRLRILVYSPIRRMCVSYNKRKGPVRVFQNDIMKTLRAPRMQASHVYNYIQLMLTERFLPSLGSMGVRYRCIVGPNKRVQRPVGNLCEHVSLSESRYGGLNIFVEPTWVEREDGPEEFVITADSETISFRMDLFDHMAKVGEEIGQWAYRVVEADEEIPEKGGNWIVKTSPPSRRARIPTEAERNLLSIMWAHQGTPEQRGQLMENMELPVRAQRDASKALRKRNAYNFVYYPAVEYCGVPQGIMVAAKTNTEAEKREVSECLLASFPFVRLLSGDNGLVAIARVREGNGQFQAETARRRLEQIGVEHTDAVCDIQKTFYFTALGRLFSDEERDWKDPWA